MALNEIIRTTKPAFDSIVAGTHATETYNDNNEYQVALDAPLEVAAANSHMSVNSSNQLVCDAPLFVEYDSTATPVDGIIYYVYET